MNLNRELLEAALLGLEAKLARLQDQIAAIKRMTGAKTKPKAPRTLIAMDDWESPKGLTAKKPAKGRKKRNLSPEARARIAAAQKKRWAAYRGKA